MPRDTPKAVENAVKTSKSDLNNALIIRLQQKNNKKNPKKFKMVCFKKSFLLYRYLNLSKSYFRLAYF